MEQSLAGEKEMKTLAQIVQERAVELEGKWVALSSRSRWTNELAGREPPPTEATVFCDGLVIQEVLDCKPQGNSMEERVLFVSDRPFVIQSMLRWYPELQVAKSQQVSGGELGQYPPVPMPRFVRGAASWRWIRLSDLGRFLDHCPHQLWDKYFKIGIHGDQRHMEVCIGNSDGPILEVDRRRVPQSHEEASRLGIPYEAGGYQVARIWVPAGWAVDVCYLVHFVRRSRRPV